MVRLLSIQSPFVYVILFLATGLLRSPSFHPGFFNTDESYYLISAERIVDGGIQYVDTIDNKPPLISWFYAAFVWIFSDNALFAIRIFTCLYLFFCAILLNNLVVGTRLIPSFSAMPGFLLIVLCSIPWYAQELNGELLMLAPVIIGFGILMPRGDDDHFGTDQRYFNAGILFALAFLIKYQGLFLFIGFFVAYIINTAPRFREMFSLFGGFLVLTAIIVLVLFFQGALPAFWKLGVLYNLDYLKIGANPGESVSFWWNAWGAVKIWGMLAILGIIGLAFFRSNYFTLPIRLRKTETVLMTWLIAGLVAVLAGGGRLYLHYFIFLFPPLAAYASRFFHLAFPKTLISAGFYAAMAIPLLLLAQGFYCMTPDRFQWASGFLKEDGWTKKMAFRMNQPHILEPVVTPEIAQRGILVLNYQPELYLRLHARCATPFTNFSMAYFRFGFFPGADGYSLISGHESPEEIYRAFSKDMPAAIIDSWEENDLGELFPVLQKKMPLLFAAYKPVTAGKNRVYLRE